MTNELYHFGVRGMKWGQRRYQNQDGSYTAQGRGRYAPNGSSRRSSSGSRSSSSSSDRRARLKKAAKIGAGVAAAGLAAYGGYRLAKSGKLNGLKALPNKRLALSGPTSKRSAASSMRSAASKAGSSVGRRVKRGVNSAQYHATRIKNEVAYRRATRGGANVRSNIIGIGGSTYSKAGLAGYRVKRAAGSVASGARRVGAGVRNQASRGVKGLRSDAKFLRRAARGQVVDRERAQRIALRTGKVIGAGMVAKGAYGVHKQAKNYRAARRRGRQNRR